MILNLVKAINLYHRDIVAQHIYQLEVASMVSCAAYHTEEFEKPSSLEDKKKCTNREPASHAPRLCFGQWRTQ